MYRNFGRILQFKDIQHLRQTWLYNADPFVFAVKPYTCELDRLKETTGNLFIFLQKKSSKGIISNQHDLLSIYNSLVVFPLKMKERFSIEMSNRKVNLITTAFEGINSESVQMIK